MKTTLFFYAPDGGPYDSGRGGLDSKSHKEQRTDEPRSGQFIFNKSGYRWRGVLGEDDLTDDNLTEDFSQDDLPPTKRTTP